MYVNPQTCAACWGLQLCILTVSACGYIDTYWYYAVEVVTYGHYKDDSMVHNSLAAGKKLRDSNPDTEGYVKSS